MSDTLEPRAVDKPFVGRWLLASLQLLVRSPVRFGMAIALLGVLDDLFVSMAQGLSIPRPWVDRLGNLTLPLLWMLVSVLARGADDAALGREALGRLRERRVWLGALYVGARLAVLFIILYWVLGGALQTLLPSKPQYGLRNPGDFVLSVLMSAQLYWMAPGMCFFPLLALVPAMDRGRAEYLAGKAMKINGFILLALLVAVMVLVAYYVASAFPLYGMTDAASLVYIGIVSYVAYRDIFERRAENAPARVVSENPASASGALPATPSGR